MNPSATVERILDAAERLFAAHDFDAVSTRDIIQAAKVNLAAVNYHFGGKAELYRAVFLRRLEPANRLRLERLTEAERRAGGAALAVRELLEIFLEPILGIGGDRPGGVPPFVRLMSRTFMTPRAEIAAAFHREMAPVVRRFTEALVRALPGANLEVVQARFRFVIGAALGSYAQLPQQVVGSSPGDRARLQQNLIRFLEAGLRAP